MSKANLPADIPRSRHQETVLLVEDEPAVRRLAEIVLTSLDYSVLVAKDGDEGLEVFKANQDEIDLIFTDVLMPGLHGPNLVDEIRKIRPEVRVLYASGYTKTSLGEAFDGYPREEVEPLLRKPYSASDLGSRMKEVFYGKESQG